MNIDKLIAEKVMGWKLVERSLRDNEGHYDALCWDKGNMEENYFRPSTKLEHAWRVVDHFKSMGYDIRVNMDKDVTYCFITDSLSSLMSEYEASSSTFQMAICLAALKVYEDEVTE